MKRYPEYKDSGIEWIGDIPREWRSSRLKFLLRRKLEYGANEAAEEENYQNPRYIRITDFGSNGQLRADTFKSLPPSIALDYLLDEGDVLFARSGATVGKTFLFKGYEGRACFAGYLIRASADRDKLRSEFLYYITQSNFYENWKKSIFIQATIQNIGADKYQNLHLAFPSIQEQSTIVSFLDHKTRQIDELIAKKERLIELLKEERSAVINRAVTKGIDPDVPMKESGIEWLGEIPAHWEVKSLKRISRIRYGLGQPPRTLEGGLPIIRATNIQRGKIVLENMMYVDPDDLPMERCPILRKDEIIVVRSGAYTADSAIITPEFEGSVSGYDMVITCQSILPQFLSFGLLAPYILNHQLIPISSRAAQPHLNAEELGSTLVVLPSMAEQEKIVNFLCIEEKRIDTAIELISKEIDLLSEYKTSLINEAVTGKIDVRDYDFADA